MDMQALGDDLDKSLRSLPRPLVEKLINVIGEFQRELGAAFPAIMGRMLPHIMAAMPEYAMGVLEINDVTATLGGVLANYLADGSNIPIRQDGNISQESHTEDLTVQRLPPHNLGTEDPTPVDVGQFARR